MLANVYKLAMLAKLEKNKEVFADKYAIFHRNEVISFNYFQFQKKKD